MRRHIYIGLTDSRKDWLLKQRVGETEEEKSKTDIISVYGHLFHIRFVPEKLGQYTVCEIINQREKFPIKRLYRYLKRNNFSGIIGPMTLKQLSKKYKNFVDRWFTDGQMDLDGNWAPGPNLVPMRQIAGDPHPVEQAKFDYNPTSAEILKDKITDRIGREVLDDEELDNKGNLIISEKEDLRNELKEIKVP